MLCLVWCIIKVASIVDLGEVMLLQLQQIMLTRCENSVLNIKRFVFGDAEMLMVEGNVCERRSKTWTEFCGNSGHCNCQCRIWEGAQHGACHAQFPGFACFCYFTCWSSINYWSDILSFKFHISSILYGYIM